jgi:hypothetical protein
VSEENVERVIQFSSQSEETYTPCEPCIGDVDYDCVEGITKETGNEALSSSLAAVSLIILVHGAVSLLEQAQI